MWHKNERERNVLFLFLSGTAQCDVLTPPKRKKQVKNGTSLVVLITKLYYSCVTHRTSFPRRTGWFSSYRMEGRWRGPPGSSARYLGSKPPLRPRPWPCLRCPRPAHLLGFRWHSTRWKQWWRLPLGPTLSPNVKVSGDLWEQSKANVFKYFLMKDKPALIHRLVPKMVKSTHTSFCWNPR